LRKGSTKWGAFLLKWRKERRSLGGGGIGKLSIRDPLRKIMKEEISEGVPVYRL